jgi:hypothetical protein
VAKLLYRVLAHCTAGLNIPSIMEGIFAFLSDWFEE